MHTKKCCQYRFLFFLRRQKFAWLKWNCGKPLHAGINAHSSSSKVLAYDLTENPLWLTIHDYSIFIRTIKPQTTLINDCIEIFTNRTNWNKTSKVLWYEKMRHLWIWLYLHGSHFFTKFMKYSKILKNNAVQFKGLRILNPIL